MTMTKERKAELVANFGQNEQDSGAAAVQVALLTERIRYLTEHMKMHKKDFSSRRGLLKMVGQRRHLLTYIRTRNHEDYKTLIGELGLRR